MRKDGMIQLSLVPPENLDMMQIIANESFYCAIRPINTDLDTHATDTNLLSP